MQYVTNNHNLDDICELLNSFIISSVFTADIDRDSIAQLIKTSSVLTIVVYDNNNKAIGLFIGYAYKHPIFNKKVANDLILYVLPESNGMIATRLLKMYEVWAKDQEVSYVMISQGTGINNLERVRSFYEHLGYKTTGFNTMKGI